MRQPRNLSGIYFRYQNPETGKWENWCFEDLPQQERDKMMENRSSEWLKSLANQLANTLMVAGDNCNILSKEWEKVYDEGKNV